MSIKVTTYFVLFTYLVSSLMGKALYRKGCFECEEELWEEVPCEKIPSNITSATTSTTQKPNMPKPRPAATRTPPTTPYHSTTISPARTTPKDPYKNCHCECKSQQNYEPESENYSTPKLDGEPVIDPNVLSNNYNFDAIVPPIYPIYGPYAVSVAGTNNNIDLFDSYVPIPQHSSYYSAANSVNNYNFPIPFEKVFSKVSKNLLNPVQSVEISLDASRGKDADPIVTSYSPKATVTDSPLEAHNPLENFDDSLATFLREVISRSPSHEAPYQAYPKPFYSVSYDKL